jgi:hypothetical protein
LIISGPFHEPTSNSRLIITKILADRLGGIASRIVSQQQRGFLSGRQAHEWIMIASEGANILDRKVYGGNMALKIDISKALDTTEWTFLLHVLRCFGLNDCFCNWISIILHSTKLSISINRRHLSSFLVLEECDRGTPNPALLFCIAEEVFSIGLCALVYEGKLTQIVACRGMLVPSHFLHAEDLLIICKGSTPNAQNVMTLFTDYGAYSGQKINKNKSKFYTSSMSMSRKHTLVSITDFPLDKR